MLGGSILKPMLCGPHWISAVVVHHHIPEDADADGVAKVRPISLFCEVCFPHHSQYVACEEMCADPLPPKQPTGFMVR